MPELPEVETVVRVIRPKIIGRKILNSKFTIPRQLLPQTPTTLVRKLKDQTIRSVERRGKFILIRLSNGTLVIHLRMSGRLYLRSANSEPHPYERAFFHLSGTNEILIFRDTRTLGTLQFFPNDQIIPSIEHLGWEPLSESISVKDLRDKLKSRTTAIKIILLDQSMWAGIGNIYASETLWVAGIHPQLPAKKLTAIQLEKLIETVPAVLQLALDKGGSTLRDFMSPDGEEGSYQKEFNVYDRKDEPCSRCHTQIRRIVQAQRSTYYCPLCQKK